LFGLMIALALRGATKHEVLMAGEQLDLPLSPKIAAIAAEEYRQKPIEKIRGSGYVVASLEAALWVFERSDSYEQAVLAAVNLGDDTDTTAAVVGQLAGAYYGLRAIPADWVDVLAFRELIEAYARRLYQERARG
jgi:ADP-ribosyl-[dinitrogen reductase] hydrolase